MGEFRFMTAGESHGKGLLVIVEGVPAGLPLSEDYIATQLGRRQRGYGRGKRQQIETDRAEIVSGVRHGLLIIGAVGRQGVGGAMQRLAQAGDVAVSEDRPDTGEQGNAGAVDVGVLGAQIAHHGLCGRQTYGFHGEVILWLKRGRWNAS